MRKRIVGAAAKEVAPRDGDWLDLDKLATVEITSEDPTHPIESAIVSPSAGTGWRAAQPGEQTVRIVFDDPQRLKHIRLLFVESEMERIQEFLLRWSPDSGKTFREIVRQQWNFSPSGASRELEDFRVDLAGVTVLELNIIPDKDGGSARASLAELRVA